MHALRHPRQQSSAVSRGNQKGEPFDERKVSIGVSLLCVGCLREQPASEWKCLPCALLGNEVHKGELSYSGFSGIKKTQMCIFSVWLHKVLISRTFFKTHRTLLWFLTFTRNLSYPHLLVPTSWWVKYHISSTLLVEIQSQAVVCL